MQESGRQFEGKKKQKFYILAAEDDLENLNMVQIRKALEDSKRKALEDSKLKNEKTSHDNQ